MPINWGQLHESCFFIEPLSRATSSLSIEYHLRPGCSDEDYNMQAYFIVNMVQDHILGSMTY